jgi:uncharacterized protein DUF1579
MPFALSVVSSRTTVWKEEKMKISRAVIGGLALAALVALPVAAQETEKKDMAQGGTEGHGMSQADMKAMEEAMVKAATPGEHHKALGRYVGDWTFTNTMWMDPSQPPMKSDGTIHAEWMLGNRYVHSTYKGSMGGQPFEGHATDGYDNVARKYVSAWVDNMGTGIMNSEGTCDADHKVCTMTSEMLDPMGNHSKMKMVTTWLAADRYKFEMYMVDPSGKDMKTMEIDAKKKN